MFGRLEARAASEGGKRATYLNPSQVHIDKNRGVGGRRDVPKIVGMGQSGDDRQGGR